MKSSPKQKSTTSKAETASKKKTAISQKTIPVMVSTAAARRTTTTRRNRSGSIERTDRFTNIDDGLVPFNYSVSGYGSKSSNMDVRDAVILCQKAYYNYGIFRHTIDLMAEFSSSKIYLSGGSKKSQDFFEVLFKKINLWSLQDKFFREYYRSGNVFLYRFDGTITASNLRSAKQILGTRDQKQELKIPARYIILNPADIQVGGNISFSAGKYYKVLTGYELERLKHPKTKEDEEVFNSLSPEVQELIKKRSSAAVKIPLDPERLSAVFYKRQDYEPLAIPMGYPVLDDINWKAEMKKMDMAISRTTQQAILLVTMGAEPDKGGVNHQNLAAMQTLFQNESVGRVLIADYTTKAEFIIPNISNLLDAKKYEAVDRDIAMGLNNMIFGQDRFANQTLKIQVFLARLEQGREAFLNEFLMPEIKRISKDLGLKNYPTPYFQEVSLTEDPTLRRVYGRLIEVGVLTPEEGIAALETGRLPDPEESVESQEKYKKLRDKGLYEPVLGGPNTQLQLADDGNELQREMTDKNIESQEKISKEKAQEMAKKSAASPSAKKPAANNKKASNPRGRPSGTKSPQTTKRVSPVGQGPQSKAYLLSKVKDTFISVEKLNKKVETYLAKAHKIEKLNDEQKDVAQEISNIIVANESPENWNAKVIKAYIKEPVDKNPERVKKVQEIAFEHQLDTYLASILYLSRAESDESEK